MTEIDLNLLKVLLAVDEMRSVTGAAQRLGIGQPAVSSSLARLRRSIGDDLFVRASKGMSPTPRAQALLGPVRRALEIIQRDVVGQAAFEPKTNRHEFVIASSDIGEMVFLPRLLDRISHEAPSVSLRMVSSPVSELRLAMESGGIDLALGYFPDLNGSNTFQQSLFDHSFVCVVRREHPIRGARMTLKQFLGARHLVVNAEGRSQEVFEAFLAKKNIQRQVVLSTRHFMTVPVIVAQSDLVATIPMALASKFTSMTGIRMVTPPFSVPRYSLRQHWHRRVHLDPANRWLRGVVADLFSHQGSGWKEFHAEVGA